MFSVVKGSETREIVLGDCIRRLYQKRDMYEFEGENECEAEGQLMRKVNPSLMLTSMRENPQLPCPTPSLGM